MRDRSFVLVAGPSGVGKTLFIERLLEAEVAFATCVRSERDATLREDQESVPASHPELHRYREAGAGSCALYRFAKVSIDGFFMIDTMQHYSSAVFIEGDRPVDYVDLSVFVAPAPQDGRSLLRRVVRGRAAKHNAAIEGLERALESPEAKARYLGRDLDAMHVALGMTQSDGLDMLRGAVSKELSARRGKTPAAPAKHWALEEGYAGIGEAGLVVVNVRSEAERHASETLIEDLSRLRKDKAAFLEVMGWRGNRTQITAVVADLSNPDDAGLKKAVARVKRATNRRPW